MSSAVFAPVVCLAFLAGIGGSAAALTAEEVLRLREAGVSDETIQKMIDQERRERGQIPSGMVEQEYAQKHIGTWNLSDGSVVLSTGETTPPAQPFDPTLPGSGSTYPMAVYPYVFPGPYGPGPGPVPRPPLDPEGRAGTR